MHLSSGLSGKHTCKHIAAVLILLRMIQSANKGNNPINIVPISPRKKLKPETTLPKGKFSEFNFTSHKSPTKIPQATISPSKNSDGPNKRTPTKSPAPSVLTLKPGMSLPPSSTRPTIPKIPSTTRQNDDIILNKTTVRWLRTCLMLSTQREKDLRKKFDDAMSRNENLISQMTKMNDMLSKYEINVTKIEQEMGVMRSITENMRVSFPRNFKLLDVN